MKTKNIIFKCLGVLVLALSFTACSKKDNNGSNVNFNDYYLNGASCIQRSTGQVVSQNFCQNLNGINCGDQFNQGFNQGFNQQFPNQFNQGFNQQFPNQINQGFNQGFNQNCGGIGGIGGIGGVGGGFGQICVGVYYYTNGFNYIPVTCNGANCSQVQLFTQNGQQVFCQ